MIQRAVIPALILAIAALGAIVALLLSHVGVPETLYALLSLAGGGTLTAIVPSAHVASTGASDAPPAASATTGPTTTTTSAPGATTTTGPDGVLQTLPPAP